MDNWLGVLRELLQTRNIRLTITGKDGDLFGYLDIKNGSRYFNVNAAPGESLDGLMRDLLDEFSPKRKMLAAMEDALLAARDERMDQVVAILEAAIENQEA